MPSPGSFPHMPWWHSALYDPYERVNVWSHGMPGIIFLILGLLAHLGAAPGGSVLLAFCCCAATTHLLSAITHVYPEDKFLEKFDHLGIAVLITGA